ncbi:MAG TPA: DUF1326 domain-containing protein [Hyphomicrobium sp.]|jgi:hypothetical protein
MTPWELEGIELVNCNCAYGCPCQFNALPTHGHCFGLGAFEIRKGHHGDVRLDGLRAIGVFSWPGPIHEGRGEGVVIIDSRADEAQRHALLRILAGEDTEPGKTVWNVFASTMERVYDPLFEEIDMEVDVDARRGRVSAGRGLVRIAAEPIRNPVTGAEHRARIELPDGFEYTVAEIGSGTSSVAGPIPFKLEATYAQLAHLHLNQSGIVR